VDLRIERLIFLHPTRPAEIDSSEQFPNDDQVGALDDFFSQGRAVDQCFGHRDGPKIREIAENGPHPQQAPFGSLGGPQMIVFRMADGSEQNGLGPKANLFGYLRKWILMPIDGDGADVAFDKFKSVVVFRGDDFKNPSSFLKNFNANSVTRQICYARFHV